MKIKSAIIAWLLLLGAPSFADESDAESQEQDAPAEEEEAAPEPQGDGIDSPRAMSGMSILGNEEAPKSLVIIPWQSSELGDNISLSDSLDDRARPVDRDVFLRELRFYEIREGQ